MKLEDLKYDSSRQVMVSVHGKEYPIRKKKDKEHYYIQHATGQLTVTQVMKQADFDPGTEADYVFNGWFQLYDNYETYKSFSRAEMAWLN